MATPYLGLDTTSVGTFNLKRMNDNTDKIEAALQGRRADVQDSVQFGADWFSMANTQLDWDVYTEDQVGNKVIRHGRWLMVEMQFKAKRSISIPSSGDATNLHLCTLGKGYRSLDRVGISALNSNLDAVVEFNPNGNCYIVAYNHTSTTIAKDTLLRIGGRYIYQP